jgi:general L-amino acid transport system permease protein
LLAAILFGPGIDRFEWPMLKGFNIAGGTQVPPELVALWAGLSVYSAAFIAEIVRGSIEAVPTGQEEAAKALGLRTGPRLFLIILPQALRIMVPQLTSQYLNIIKSSTLGAAVAYPEIFQIFAGTVMNQAGKEIETIVIVMAIFLVINLLTSAFMNWYNQRVALVER